VNNEVSEPFAMFSESGLVKSPSMAKSSKSPSFFRFSVHADKTDKRNSCTKSGDESRQ